MQAFHIHRLRLFKDRERISSSLWGVWRSGGTEPEETGASSPGSEAGVRLLLQCEPFKGEEALSVLCPWLTHDLHSKAQ